MLCSVLPRVAVCCSQFVAVNLLRSLMCAYCPSSDEQFEWEFEVRVKTLCGAVCCRVLQLVAVSLLQSCMFAYALVLMICLNGNSRCV